MLPTLAAAPGRQVEQLDAVMLPTDESGAREGGRGGCECWRDKVASRKKGVDSREVRYREVCSD